MSHWKWRDIGRECPFCGKDFWKLKDTIEVERKIWHPWDLDSPKWVDLWMIPHYFHHFNNLKDCQNA